MCRLRWLCGADHAGNGLIEVRIGNCALMLLDLTQVVCYFPNTLNTRNETETVARKQVDIAKSHFSSPLPSPRLPFARNDPILMLPLKTWLPV